MASGVVSMVALVSLAVVGRVSLQTPQLGFDLNLEGIGNGLG